MPYGPGPTMWILVTVVILVWLVFFVGLWSLIVVLMAWLGGWGRLAKVFAASEQPQGDRRLTLVNGAVGWARYRRLLTVTVNAQGIFIEPRWMFRICHRTLFIPWTEVVNARRLSVFHRHVIAFDVGSPKLAAMRLPSAVFQGSPVVID